MVNEQHPFNMSDRAPHPVFCTELPGLVTRARNLARARSATLCTLPGMADNQTALDEKVCTVPRHEDLVGS